MRSSTLIALTAALIFAAGSSWSSGVRGADSDRYFVIAASPASQPSSYASALYSLDTKQGSLKLVRTLTTRRQGTQFVRVYDDARLVLIGSDGGPHQAQFDLVHFDEPTRTHQIETTAAAKDVFPATALILVPGRAPLLALQTVDGTGDSSAPLRASTRGIAMEGNEMAMEWADYADMLCSGYVLDAAEPGLSREPCPVYGMQDGVFRRGHPGGSTEVSFAPPELSDLKQKNGIGEVINNSAIRLLTSYELVHGKGSDAALDYLVYDKAAAKWSRLTVSGTRTSVTAFGARIAFVVGFAANEYTGKSWPASRLSNEYFASLDDRLTDVVRSGRVVLIDTRSKGRIEFDLDSADVDVLHFDGKDLLYRVGPSLFMRSWNGDALNEPRKLLTNKAIGPAVHWAFKSAQ